MKASSTLGQTVQLGLMESTIEDLQQKTSANEKNEEEEEEAVPLLRVELILNIAQGEKHLIGLCRSNSHVTRVCLPGQSAPEKHNEGNKSPQTFAHLVNFSKVCLPCFLIIQSCYLDCRINKSFACSRCVICISCSVHLISTFYVREGLWVF